MKRGLPSARVLSGALLMVACHGAPPRAAAPAAAPLQPSSSGSPDAGAELFEPPPPGRPPQASFPEVWRQVRDDGLALRVLERHTYPVIQIELLVRSGMASDGDRPGLAAVAGELLKTGGAGPFSPREIAERSQALGTTLEVLTDLDATHIELSVTSGGLDAALELVSAVALHPRFDATEFRKLQAREIERVQSLAVGSAEWSASFLLHRELYHLRSGSHPYARSDALPSELQRLQLGDCRGWHERYVVPSNASLIVVGDVTPGQVRASVERWFAGWHGEKAPAPPFVLPLPPVGPRVFIADRPGSAQSQIEIGMLGPPRQSAEWPALATANQILGGGVSSRLFLDVRERRSLAYSARSTLEEVAVGPVPVVLSAGTQTAKTAESVRALLADLSELATRAPAADEVERAQTFLADRFLFQLENVGSLAKLTADLDVLGLPPDYYDSYRQALRALQVPGVAAAATQFLERQPMIVVAGDAVLLAQKLASFGPVTVFDPEHEFAVKQTLPAGSHPD
jgi:zinc protease